MDSSLRFYVEQYESATKRFEKLVSGLINDELDVKHPAG